MEEEEEFGNPEDLTGVTFAPDQTGQVIRWRDKLSSKKREQHNKFGQSSVELILKDRPAQDLIELLDIIKDKEPAAETAPQVEQAVAPVEEPASTVIVESAAPSRSEAVSRGSILRIGRVNASV